MSNNPPYLPNDLRGKTALVTGSSRGLGAAFAEGLARAGVHVVLNGRHQGPLDEQAARLRELGGETSVALFDVTDEAAIQSAAREVRERRGGIDILVNNAGVNLRGPLEELSTDTWDSVLGINLKGPWLVAKHFVPAMIGRKAGKVINIASLMSFGGRETTGPYTASKGGVALLTKAMAVEWARHNIQCNAIAPGYFLSKMTQPLADDPKFDGWVRSRTPSERWGDPQELVPPLLFLASAASSYVNGQVLYVDGGWTAKL